MLKLHVVFAVDRAGLVGEDGETHHGIYDLGFLRQVPGMKILSPASCAELSRMLTWAVEEYDGPVAIRYPRGGDGAYSAADWLDETSNLVCHRTGCDCTVITYGKLINHALEAAELLAKCGIEISVLRLAELSDMSLEHVAETVAETSKILILEEACTDSGIREALAWRIHKRHPGADVHGIDLGHRFVPHGDVKRLYQQFGLDAQSVCDYISEVVRSENKKTP